VQELSSDDDASSDESDGVPALPSNLGESQGEDVDLDMLMSLPTSMQQEYIGEIKRVRRQQNRSKMLPVAANPEGFSSLSIGSFLKDAHLSIAVNEMNQKQAKEVMHGNVIVSEANRQFLLEKDE